MRCSKTVDNVIKRYTEGVDKELLADFKSICKELGFNTIKTKKMERYFVDYLYSTNRHTSHHQSISNEIKDTISQINCEEKIDSVLENILALISPKVKQSFPSDDELKCAIICEMLETTINFLDRR